MTSWIARLFLSRTPLGTALRRIARRLRPHRVSAGGLFFTAACVSDVGLVRKENQDSFVCHPDEGLFCVADGMGGGSDGALASGWTCGCVDEVAMPQTSVDGCRRVFGATLQRANERIRAYAHSMGFQMMGTTVAILYLNPGRPDVGLVCHAGDSRVYRLREGRLDALTSDHTVGNAMSRNAFSSEQASALASRRNPLAHILTRSVGAELRVNPEWKRIRAFAGDRYLLCSDGVHDMLSDDFLRRAMAKPSAEKVVAKIAEAVRRRGAADNYTAICVFAQ